MRASGAGVVSIVSFLAIFFMFTVENGSVCCFPPDGGIWASGTMVEAVAATVGAGEVLEKTAASGVASLLRETDRSVAPIFILLVFLFPLTYFSLVRHKLQTSLPQKQKKNK